MVNPNQCPVKKAQFTLDVAQLPPDFLICTDESTVCLEVQQRWYTWAKKGFQLKWIGKVCNGICYSLLPAVLLDDGLSGCIIQEGLINQLDFKFFLTEILIPNMNSFPAKNSVLIPDNTKIHHRLIEQICSDH